MLRNKAGIVMAISLAILPLVVIRSIRPIFLIRFGSLRSERLGHYLENTETYLSEKDLNADERRTIDIFYNQSPISNYQVKKMWGRQLNVFQVAKWLDKANRLIPFGEAHKIPWRSPYPERDVYGILSKTAPHLKFTKSEVSIGHQKLKEMGISKQQQFICFHARDPAYLEAFLPMSASDTNWDYQDFRDSDINNYLAAAETMVSRGYYSLRMGAKVQEPLDTDCDGIIDYATINRTEFLDIFLAAKCRFFLCSTNGIYAIPMCFRRPVAYANWIPLGRPPSWGPKDIFIVKKLWLRADKRYLTFNEIIHSEIGQFQSKELYENFGIDVIENTSDEINALALEMDDRLNGTWVTTVEDEILQDKFRCLFEPNDLHQVFLSRMGAEFLKQNKDLLP